jgi:four helix bundle protein
VKSHRDLDVWRIAIEFAHSVYNLTASFPKNELYGLTSQLRRAAVSIASNIAEGAARQTKKEFAQFLYCSLGSAAEVETQLELVRLLDYLSNEQIEELTTVRVRLSQMLYGLIRSLKR